MGVTAVVVSPKLSADVDTLAVSVAETPVLSDDPTIIINNTPNNLFIFKHLTVCPAVPHYTLFYTLQIDHRPTIIATTN